MPIWPTTLPQLPQRNNWKDKAPNNLLRSDMDAGTAKVRPKGGDLQWQATAMYVLTAAQLATLRTFIFDTLSGGAVCFDWPHPTRGTMRAEIIGGTDSLYDESLWGSTTAYQITLQIGYWPDAPTTE